MQLMRLYTIKKTLLQHGLDELIPPRWLPWYAKGARYTAFWLRNKYPDKSRGERIRLALQSLGPVFIKFGQMLSTRRDLLPPDIADELTLLQDKVPPFDSTLARQTIEKALGLKRIDELFDEFSTDPLASASIAQVHTARLKPGGEHVVVKVIRPRIDATIHADIELLYTLAALVQRWLPDGKRLRPVEVVKEYEKTILEELNLLQEASNGIQLKRNFEDSRSLYIPHIYSDFCRKNVMVMERIHGIPVADIEALHAQGTDMKKLAERGVEVFFTQVFRDSFFHADMHPGNIFVATDNPADPQYIGIDFGIVGTLNREDKRYLAENFVAFFNRDYRKVAELHVDSGWVPADTDLEEFEVAVRTVCEPIFQKPLADISFGIVLLQLFNTARKFNMQVQPQLVLLQKTLLYIEGLGRQLYPQLDLWQTAKPFLENWMQEQIGAKALFKKVRANLPYWSEKMPEVPDLLFDTLKQLKHLPQQQQQWISALQQQQHQQHRSRRYQLLGSTLIVTGTLLPLYPVSGWYGVAMAGLGMFSFMRGWLISSKPQ
ncbi:ubiquinone biosynthesis regulatory protein kinase UbiB [Lacimicrobium sp. SS2-24]|uniref:ubiquinone biosynthesis regulatory protein kinase UbiB n=1 Tax=Lacimicrobium sp. SS2-24 TaxID=2005569 RepID=UPI000B4BEAD0|nr:ubiquinone biosynthesis regulatory protein kinase UbiB [Lacimicrobium sp. SS2-24]